MAQESFRGKRIAIYARYSSSLQREASIGDQVRRCTDYVTGRDGDVNDDLIFTDKAASGASMVRPGFESLLQQLDAIPRIDAIVTEDVSRISRGLRGCSFHFSAPSLLRHSLAGRS